MNIAILKRTLRKKGGLEKHSLRLGQAFQEKGCKVTFLTSDAPAAFPFHHISLQTLKWPRFMGLEQFDERVKEYLSAYPADRILGLERNSFQTHLRAGSGVHAAYLKQRAISEGKFSQLFRSCHPLHLKILQLEKEGFEHPSLQKIFTNSNMVREEILSFYKVDPAKIEVIHNGVEWEEMSTSFSDWEKDKPCILENFGLDPHLFHFLFIGNGFLRKGVDNLLKALSRLKRKDFFLSIVGKEKNLFYYQHLVNKLHLDDQVRFFGPQDNIYPFYQLADALVIPSWYDPFANVTIEALAMGVFVISSKNNGGHEILNPDTGYILSQVHDIDALTHLLQKAMEKPKTLDSSTYIRNSVAHLDFSNQTSKLIDSVLR